MNIGHSFHTAEIRNRARNLENAMIAEPLVSSLCHQGHNMNTCLPHSSSWSFYTRKHNTIQEKPSPPQGNHPKHVRSRPHRFPTFRLARSGIRTSPKATASIRPDQKPNPPFLAHQP